MKQFAVMQTVKLMAPWVIAGIGGFVASNYANLHVAFCNVGG